MSKYYENIVDLVHTTRKRSWWRNIYVCVHVWIILQFWKLLIIYVC